ncbi:MAG TPA: biopolymer transporter ExbD [Pirellulales bacterium]
MSGHKKRKRGPDDKVDIQMTPMLDMIFQLLVFFILTFNPGEQEGQLEVQMSSTAGASSAAPTTIQDMAEIELGVPLVLKASSAGGLAGITIGSHSVTTMPELRSRVEQLAAGDPEAMKVDLTASSNLDYQYVMQAIEVMGRVGVKNINFGAPR